MRVLSYTYESQVLLKVSNVTEINISTVFLFFFIDTFRVFL